MPQLIRIPTNTDRLELQERRVGSVTIRTWKRADNNWSLAPWLFAIQKDGEEEKTFTGVPNYCETRRRAFFRAWHRARWLNTGQWAKHYGPSPHTLIPGTYKIVP